MDVVVTPVITAPANPAHEDQHDPSTGTRALAALRCAAPALAGYAAVRVIGLLMLLGEVRERNLSLVEVLTAWDAGWYLRIAEQGYDHRVQELADGRIDYTDLAFFPLYPAVIKALTLTGLSASTAGPLAASASGLAAAWGMFVIGSSLYDRRVGTVLAIIWGALPHAVVQSMVYAEALFTALAAWSLFAVMHRRWVLAGALCLLAGLTRPTSAALIAAIGFAAAMAVLRGEDGRRPWLCAALAPVGLVGFWVFVGQRLGRPDGWFWVQRTAWSSRTDDGSWVLDHYLSTLTPEVLLGDLVITVALTLGIALVGLLVLQRAPAPLIVYAVAVFALTVTTAAYYFTKGRLLLPAFPLLLPLAVPLARAGWGVLAVVLPAVALASGWYGAFLLTRWPYAL